MGQTLDQFGAILTPFDIFSAFLLFLVQLRGALWGRFWPFFGIFWDFFGHPCHFFGHFWTIFGHFWVIFGPFLTPEKSFF